MLANGHSLGSPEVALKSTASTIVSLAIPSEIPLLRSL
jgi:hypothetical protein